MQTGYYCVLGKGTYNRIASTYEWLAGSNRWQLDSKIEKVSSLSHGRGTLTNTVKKYLPKP